MKRFFLVLLAVVASAIVAGCGDNNETNESSVEQRIARERADAASNARQGERLRSLEREVRSLRKKGPEESSATSSTKPAESSPQTNDGWPAWTVILVSAATKSEAVAVADRASGAGLSSTGVLNSDNHSSLRAGYWVAYAGITDRAGATRIQTAARRVGFDDAYVRYVSGN